MLASNQGSLSTVSKVDRRTEEVIFPNKEQDEKKNVSEKQKILVILQTGNEDSGRRATLAFAMGVSSIFTQTETTIFLMGKGVVWGRKGEMERVNVKGYEPLSSYFNSFLLHNGRLLVSVSCMQYQDHVDTVLAREDIVASVEYVSFTTLVHLSKESSVITF